MPRLLLALVLVLAATTAHAQKIEESPRTPLFSRAAHSSVASSPASLGSSNLVLDDGTAENNIGLTAGGQFIWFNRFTPPAGDFPMFIQSAEVYFDTSPQGFPVGSVYDVYVYSDPDGNPANGATFVQSATGQVVTSQGSFLTSTFASPVEIATPGDVLILVVNRTNTGVGIFPAALDQTAPSSPGRSFVGIYAAGTNPGNPPVLPAPTQQAVETVGPTFVGNWMIRGTYTTEPVVGPNLVVPGALAFGDVPTGESDTRTVTMTNNGTETVTITSITVAGALFTIDTAGTDLSLAPGETTTFSVTFSPTADGPATGTVTVTSNDPDSPQTITLTGSGFSPPPNDDQADATEITADGTYTGTNVAATLEPGEPEPTCALSPGSASVWWVFTPSESGLLTVDLDGSGYDTVLSFHEADGTQIACNEDAPGRPDFTSLITNTPVEGGQPVYIRVDGYDGEQGTISLTLTFNAGAEIVTTPIPPGSTATGNTWNRPVSVGGGTSGSCSLSGSATAVQYDFRTMTVSEAGAYTLTTQWTGFDGYLLLYEDSFNPADQCLNLIALNDDFGGTSGSRIADVQLEAGTYVVVFTAFGNTGSGAYTGTVVGPAAVAFPTVANEGAPGTAESMLTASPNPVRSEARVRLAVETAQDVTVAVFDVTGRQVATLFRGTAAAGQPVELALDASALPAGVYVVRASGTDLSLTERITVVR